MDLTTITAALGGIKTATEIAKNLKSIDGFLEKAELKLKMAELIEALADAKMSIVDARTLLEQKDAEIDKLTKAYAFEQSVFFDRPSYWVKLENGEKDGPFCQRCYDKEKTLVRLQTISRGYWTCEACDKGYQDDTYEPPEIKGLGGW